MNKIYNRIDISMTPNIGPFKQRIIAAIWPEDYSHSTISTTSIKGLDSKKTRVFSKPLFHPIERSTTLSGITHKPQTHGRQNPTIHMQHHNVTKSGSLSPLSPLCLHNVTIFVLYKNLYETLSEESFCHPGQAHF